MVNKYLVISPNGYGNVGDDICAYSGKYAIEQVDPNAEVKISQPPMKLNLVEWADYIILSGGGILYDRASKNLENYMQYIDKAHELGKKSAVLGVGVQGIVTDDGKKRYVESLNKCEFVSVRTEKDRQLLEDIGFNKAVATFDIAFFTPAMLESFTPKLNWLRKRKQQKLLKDNKPRIGICMINLKMLKGDSYDGIYRQFDEGVAKFIGDYSNKFDIYLLQHAKEDGGLMREVARSGATFVPYNDINDLPNLFGIFNNLDMMMGVRLHSIALGLMSDTPTIGVGSTTAKQKRLANYALPTLDKQFYSFNDVDGLLKLLKNIGESGKINLSRLNKAEQAKIQELNQQNLTLLKKMIS